MHSPDPDETPPPEAEEPQKDAGTELREGLWKALGAAKRMVDELPGKASAKAAKKVGSSLRKVAAREVGVPANEALNRLEEAVVTGAKEVGRALENVTNTALDKLGGKSTRSPSSRPPRDE